MHYLSVDMIIWEHWKASERDISRYRISVLWKWREWADPKEDEYIIDVCAAPGGKSLHLADKLTGKGHVEARDLTPYKVDMIRDNIARIGIDNIEAVCQDATVYDEASEKKADILIADLPCSGLGVLGKKTDLKYKMNPDTQEELVHLQREILSVVHRYVKSGGKLLYSTCTIHRAEIRRTQRGLQSSIRSLNW